MELATVVMPVYNNQSYIKEAIESVLNSNYKNFELIIVDDGSTDNSYNIACKYALLDNRVVILRHDFNKGANEAIKTAIYNSKGEYIFISAADDITLENRIEKTIEIFRKRKDVGIIVSNSIIIDENTYETGEYYEFDKHITNDNIVINQFKRNYCLGATMAIRNIKDILLKDNMLKYLDDYEIALEYILNNYNIFLSREPLIKYRVHKSNYSNNRRELFEKVIKVMSKYTIEEIMENLYHRGYEDKEIYVTLGIQELFKRNYKLGHELLIKAFSIKTCNERLVFENNFYLGVSSYKLNYYKISYDYFKRAFFINQYEPTILNNYGVLNYILGSNPNLAIDLIERSLNICPNYIDALQNKINIENNKEQIKVTERILENKIIKRSNYII